MGPASGCPGMPSSSRSHRAAGSARSRSRSAPAKRVASPAKRSTVQGSRPRRPLKPVKKPAASKPAARRPPSGPSTPAAARPSGGETATGPLPFGAESRRHVLSLAFLRDGDDFFARIETDAGQITELKHRALDQLLSLVAGELEDLLE